MSSVISYWYQKIKGLFSPPYPNENYDSFNNYWEDHASEFPRRADIETTPYCDARCVPCRQQTMTKKRGIMSLETFKTIADILKTHNCPIRGMYTTGNPLLDPTLFEKFAYARQIKIMAPFVSLNCTTSKLTPNLHQKILESTDNITLSFFAIGNKFEYLTGGLNWDYCYKNAIDFIKTRDRIRPDYRIFIGCNMVDGYDLAAVKRMFKGYRVEWAVDTLLRYGDVLTGPLSRAIKDHTFRCDSHEGVLMIKWNGNIEACSSDFGEETLYANILRDDWETVRKKFFESYRKTFSLCARCDYHAKYWMVKKNHFHDIKYDDWQQPFLQEGAPCQQ